MIKFDVLKSKNESIMKVFLFSLFTFIGTLGYSQCSINVYLSVNNATDSSQCDGSITANTIGNSGPLTYTWSCNGCVSFNSPSLSGLCYGANGTLIVTDTAGCTGTAIWNIGLSPCSGFGANVNPSSTSGPNLCDGSILASPFGGTPPYYYAIGNGTVSYGSNNPTNLCAGTYTVNVGDGNGCSFSTVTTVGVDSCAGFLVSFGEISTTDSITCNGSINISPTGGTAPYTYFLNNYQISPNQQNLCFGSSVITVFDANGCSYTSYSNLTLDTTNLGPCSGFSAYATTANASDSLTCDGSMTVIPFNGTAPYSYSFANVGTNVGSTVANLCIGTYVATVVDANGCAASVTGNVLPNNSGTGDTIILNGNISIDSSFIAADSSDWINDCSIYYDSVISGYINSFSAISNDSVIVNWVLGYSNGDSVVVTAVYNLNSGNGTYLLTLLLFCPQKSVPKYLIVNSSYNFELGSILEANKDKLMVYPNPASDFIYLKGINHKTGYKVIDLSGKEILFGKYYHGIDISDLNQGTYLLIVNQKDKQEVLRFTK